MEKWLLCLVAVMLAIPLVFACGDDDDDDNDDAGADDDATDDDTTDDDATDDDSGDDDGALVPPYDPEDCGPFIDAWYETCHLAISFDELELTAEDAIRSCEDFEYNFWTCAIDCYTSNDDECVELFECVQQECVDP
ncbi:MAG: hypothetical protein P9L99_11955 [Candidatus Lernaella stagnicola]|nr:hypothetical protein [Candidatus Lernaella stagnicola]